MQRLTLREAAERTSRSITTLRRYIRSGRLHAEKRYGRFGPEYYVAEDDLTEAGLDLESARDDDRSAALATRQGHALPSVAADAVPIVLYQELQMKHEQLLVQYGMVRAGGLRAIDLQEKVDSRQQQLVDAEREIRELNQQLESRHGDLQSRLAEAQLELEGRGLEISALKSKVRALEMLTRNAVTNETIENQFLEIMRQERRVENLGRDAGLDRAQDRSGSGDTFPNRSDSSDPLLGSSRVHAVGETVEPEH